MGVIVVPTAAFEEPFFFGGFGGFEHKAWVLKTNGIDLTIAMGRYGSLFQDLFPTC
jgi:hypothetical protein